MHDSRRDLVDALADRYRLERELGRGGMATVYLAEDLKHGRHVALKVLHPHLAHRLGPERFRREIALAARLHHPHILAVFDSGSAAEHLWFTMPFVRGESLRDRLRRDGPLPLGDALRIAGQVARALDHAHREGVVHRDVKPENILLTRDGDTLVADFGIARPMGDAGVAEDSQLTETGAAIGTPAYMSPEQARGDARIDARSDVYALGVVTFEMLAGEPPFTGPTAHALIVKRFTSAAPHVRDRRADVPEGVDEAVDRALAMAPADRFASAADFARALEAGAMGISGPAPAYVPGMAASAAATPTSSPAAWSTTPSATPAGATPAGATPAGAPPAATVAATPPTPAGPAAMPPPVPDARRLPPVALAIGLAIALAAAGIAGGVAWWRGRDGAGSAAAVARPASVPRIAVLPFQNQGDSANAYFADGMTDAVRGRLAGLQDIEVIARASSVQYAGSPKPPTEIARELGVTYLLTGTVRWLRTPQGPRVQVSPELVEVSADGTPRSRWGAPFDAEIADVFRVQGEIASRVVEAMHVALVSSSDRARLVEVPTRDPVAYDAFLRGEAIALSRAGPAELRRAVVEYERAVRLDPTFVDAWGRLAQARSRLYGTGDPDPALRRAALEAARRAHALDSSRASGHRALGSYYFSVEVDPAKAIGFMEAARRLDPGDAGLMGDVGYVRLSLGQWTEGMRELRDAARLDPRNPTTARRLALSLINLRRFDEARTAAERAVALAPTNLGSVSTLILVSLSEGNLAGARRSLAAVDPGIDRDELLAYLATYGDLGWFLEDADRRRVLALGPEAFDGDRAAWAAVRAQFHGWLGDTAAVRVWADSALVEYERQLRDAPNDALRIASRGLALANLGRKAEAIAEGERGARLLPVSSDALNGPYQLHLLAQIYVKVGEPEKAIEVLERLVASAYIVTPGWLRIDPTFAGLRGRARFERLVAGR